MERNALAGSNCLLPGCPPLPTRENNLSQEVGRPRYPAGPFYVRRGSQLGHVCLSLAHDCIPTRGTKVPHTPHEIKFDGYRLRVERAGDRVRLITRPQKITWPRRRKTASFWIRAFSIAFQRRSGITAPNSCITVCFIGQTLLQRAPVESIAPARNGGGLTLQRAWRSGERTRALSELQEKPFCSDDEQPDPAGSRNKQSYYRCDFEKQMGHGAANPGVTCVRLNTLHFDKFRVCYSSLLSFRFPQCGLFCFGSNSPGLCRLIACITAMSGRGPKQPCSSSGDRLRLLRHPQQRPDYAKPSQRYKGLCQARTVRSQNLDNRS